MADKNKTPIAQDAQGTQEKREKRHRIIDQAIEAAKAEKAGMKPLYINAKIVPPFDAVNWDAIDPDSPNYDPEKAKEYGKMLIENGKNMAQAFTDANEKLKQAAQAVSNAILTNITFTGLNEELRQLFEKLYSSPNLITLYPYLKKLAAGPEYAQYGTDPEEIIELLEFQGTDQNGDIIPGSEFERLIDQAAEYWEKEQARTEGRKQRKAAKEQAQGLNAIMTLKGGKYPIPSANDLWNYFAPGKICEMGTLDAALIDPETGRVRKKDLEAGELINIDRAASPQAFWILSALFYNSVEDVRAEFVKSGELTFYVKGVLDELSTDPRGLLPAEIAQDGQLDISRKTAGVLYLENLFKPLQNYIGVLPNGSRYSVFNYIGYDADSDTMTIKAPYIYQLWKRTQTAYFARLENKKAAEAAGKKPTKEDLKPLEMNALFRKGAITEDAATLEAAMYITDKMLQAGSTKNKPKETCIKFATLVKNCPTMQQRIAEIENSDRQNPAALINGELRKIKKAVALILNPEKCSATEVFNIVEIEPVKTLDATAATWQKRVEFIPPTKGKLNDQLRIKWYRETDSETD